MTDNLAGLVKLIGITVILAALWGILSFYAGDTFLESGNLTNLMRRVSIASILGIGVAMVIMIGGIDLSLGSLVCLTACCLGLFLQVDYQPEDSIAVLEINKEDKTLTVRISKNLTAGTVVRLHQAERNRGTTLAVQAVQELQSETMGLVQVLKIEGALQRSVKTGELAQVGWISVAEPLKAARFQLSEDRLTLQGWDTESAKRLRRRDHLWLTRPDGDFKEETIVEKNNGTLVLDSTTLPQAGDWYAVPIRRNQFMSVPVAIATTIAMALGLGLLHGVLVTWLRLQPFVVTLCGLLAYRGLARLLCGDRSVSFGTEYVDSLNWFSTSTVSVTLPLSGGWTLSFPYAFFVFAAIAVMAVLLMNYTIWGRYMLALGSNEEATRLSGVNTHRIKLLAYSLCGLLAGVCGVLFAMDAGSISPSSAGSYMELYAIAAAVLGGCSLRGGEGSILGVIIGTLLMQTLSNMILLLEIPQTVEQINLGVVILLAVIADEIVRRLFSRKRRTASEPRGAASVAPQSGQ